MIADWLRRHHGWPRRAAVAAVVGLSAVGLVVSAALAIQSQRLFILPSHDTRLDFVRFQYDLHDDLGGDRPPGARESDAIGAPGPRGEVVILDDCRGLYWSDGIRWWPLELGGADGLVITRALQDGRTVLLEAPSWRLVADTTGDTVMLSYEREGDGTFRLGPRVDRLLADGASLQVMLDRVNSELTVRSGGKELLVAWLVDLAGTPQPGPEPGEALERTRPRPAPTPLCDSLRARLGS